MNNVLTIYSLSDNEKWDSIVRSFSRYDSYWLSGYVKAFKLHGDGEPVLLYYENNGTRGINVVMKRDVSEFKFFEGVIEKGKFFDFSSPYGYGGWIIEGVQKEELFSVYENWCKSNSIVSEFIRFHPVIGNHSYCDDFYEVVPLGQTVALDLSTPEIIWDNITGKNKNMIRKALKNDVRIFNGRSPLLFSTFRTIYNKTMERDEAASYYFFEPDFYESICDDFPHNAQIFYAVYRNEIIAASIMLMANGYMNYHLSGSLKEYSSLAPSNLLLYEAALWGAANGCKTLYLGGGVGSGEDSLFKFKKSFYRQDNLYRFYVGKKIFLQDEYDSLVCARKQKIQSNFFPTYRAE